MVEDLEVIRKFNEITISGICKKLNINQHNVYNNKAKKEKMKMVREELIRQIKELLKEV